MVPKANMFSVFSSLKLGMAMGQGEFEGCAPHGFVLLHSRFAPHDGKNFLTPSLPLEAREALPHLLKHYFFLICPQLLQFSLIKVVSLIKIYLKLQINLSYQIKIIFSKNWIILLKYLTRQYHNKNKKSNNTKSMIQ